MMCDKKNVMYVNSKCYVITLKKYGCDKLVLDTFSI